MLLWTMGKNRLLLYALLGIMAFGLFPKLEAQNVMAVGKRDIIFLIDSSMGASLISAVRDFIKKFIDTLPIGPDQVQVGVAMFSTTPRSEINLNSYSSKESLSSALARIKPKPSAEVNIGAALDFVRTRMLRAESGSRIQDHVTQLVLLLTSKKSKDSVQQPADALRQMGVLTLAAGSKAADVAELRQIAFDESVVFMLKDFRYLLRKQTAIMSPLSTLSAVVVTEDPTETGLDVTTVHTHIAVRDIVFLVDGSSYVENNLQSVLDFITGVVNRLDVRPERVRIGLMQFAEGQRTEFYLNTHSTKQDVLSAIAQLSLMGGRALNTRAALEYALANHFQPTAGSRRRQGIQQVLVLITGGPSQDEVKSVADRVAIEGVLTFAVGAGQVEESFLKTVAFVENLAYYRRSFADLSSVVDEIMTPLISVVGVTDTEFVTPGPSGGKRDVAFLIDGSDDVRADFPYIRDLISKVIEPLDVGINKVRVSVVQHSERPSPSFYLNTYKTKDEVLRAVNELTLAGGRSLNTGVALTFMKNTILSPAYGSRAGENVPQFLIVLTGGRSRDSVREPAVALKTEGVVPFGVGVRNADPKQIEAISHNPSFAFNVKEFSQLNTVQERLKNYVNLPDQELKVLLERGNEGYIRNRDVPRQPKRIPPTTTVCSTDVASCGCCLMQNQMWKMETFFNMSLDELQRGMERAHAVLNNIRASRSAFSVALTDTRLCVGPNREDSVVKYGSVFINLGDGYSTNTGAFVAPRSGVYSLALTVYSDAGAAGATLAACARLRLNGRTLASPSEKNNQDQEDSVSAVLAVQLNAGDRVDVALPAGCFLCDDNNHYNTFTGFLLYATD